VGRVSPSYVWGEYLQVVCGESISKLCVGRVSPSYVWGEYLQVVVFKELIKGGVDY
jgi:hypothetical protein